MQGDFHPKYVRRRMKILLRDQRKRLTFRTVCSVRVHAQSWLTERCSVSCYAHALDTSAMPSRSDAILEMQWAWGLACIPLIPLLATPVPNLPLYYAGYKVRYVS